MKEVVMVPMIVVASLRESQEKWDKLGRPLPLFDAERLKLLREVERERDPR